MQSFGEMVFYLKSAKSLIQEHKIYRTEQKYTKNYQIHGRNALACLKKKYSSCTSISPFKRTYRVDKFHFMAVKFLLPDLLNKSTRESEIRGIESRKSLD